MPTLADLRATLAAGDEITLTDEELRATLGADVLDWLDLSADSTREEILDSIDRGVSLSDEEVDEYVEALLSAKDVGPAARKKLEGLIDHYRKMAHPFTACVRDNTKRFGKERAERVCAVLKDIMKGTTKWRKGPKKLADLDLDEIVTDEFVEWLDDFDLVALAGDTDLETVDVKDVEILAEGGPFMGSGSGMPKEGLYLKKADLDRIVANSKELADEVRAPLKFGHNKEQRLARNSGLALDDEMPGLGLVDATTLKVKRDKKGKYKVFGTVRSVPKKVAKLMSKGTFGRRSAEFARLRSQTKFEEDGTTPKLYDGVITGLALLGAKRPAIRTLGDVLALFSEEDLSAEDLLALDEAGKPGVYIDAAAELKPVGKNPVTYVDFADETAWDPEEGLEWLRGRVAAALNPSGTYGEGNFYVRDVAPGKALICRYRPGGEEVYVVGFTIDGDSVDLAPSADWTKVEQAWKAVSSSYTAAAGDGSYTVSVTGTITSEEDLAAALSDIIRPELARVLSGRADTSGEMPEVKDKKTQVELSDEQIIALATVFDIEETDAAKRRELVLAKMSEVAPETEPTEPPKTEEPKKDEPTTPTGATLSEAELAVLKAKADRGDTVFSERQIEKRDADIRLAQKEGRIDLSDEKREFWEKQYEDLGYEKAHGFLFQMPVNEDLARVYGGDDDLTDPETRLASEDATYEAYMLSQGYDRDELPSLASRSAA